MDKVHEKRLQHLYDYLMHRGLWAEAYVKCPDVIDMGNYDTCLINCLVNDPLWKELGYYDETVEEYCYQFNNKFFLGDGLTKPFRYCDGRLLTTFQSSNRKASRETLAQNLSRSLEFIDEEGDDIKLSEFI